MADLTLKYPLDGLFNFRSDLIEDETADGKAAAQIIHPALLSGGGLDAVCGPKAECLARYSRDGEERAAAALFKFGKGAAVWARGSSHFIQPDKPQHYFETQNSAQNYNSASLMRKALQKLGFFIQHSLDTAGTKAPGDRHIASRQRLLFRGLQSGQHIQDALSSAPKALRCSQRPTRALSAGWRNTHSQCHGERNAVFS